MAAITILIPFVLTAMVLPTRRPWLRVHGSSGDGDRPMRLACSQRDTADLSAELLTMSRGTFTNEVKIFHQKTDTTKHYLKVDPSTNAIVNTEDSDNATVFIMRTEEDKLQADSRFELEYLSASDERHAIRAVREDVFGANSCAPYNLAAVPLSIQGDGSGQANETMEALESSLYYQITGVIREPQCN